MAGLDVTKISCFPKSLTEADWQKKAGPLAKTDKTGLGPELKKAEALHKKLSPAKLQLPAKPDTQDELQDALKAVDAYCKATIDPLVKQLGVVEATAKKTQAGLAKANGAAAVAKSAADIAKQAKDFAGELDSLDFVRAQMAARAALNKNNAAENKAMDVAVRKFIAGAKKFLEDDSADSWGLHIDAQGRNLSNAVHDNEEYTKKFWPKFQKFKAFDLNSLRLMDNDAKSREKRVMIVKAALLQAVSMAKHDR